MTPHEPFALGALVEIDAKGQRVSGADEQARDVLVQARGVHEGILGDGALLQELVGAGEVIADGEGVEGVLHVGGDPGGEGATFEAAVLD